MKQMIYVVLMFGLLLSACTATQDTTPVPAQASESVSAEPTSTPDYCAPENLRGQIARVNELTRVFDDYATLASNSPQEQLIQIIPSMQEVRRAAESQPVPVCLSQLKIYQVNHMSVVINTLMLFNWLKQTGTG